MRIISGRYKGHKIHANCKGVRPTTDRVKESLFSIIRHRLPESDVLDLFAGIGGLGLESISEGAKSCCFVDKSGRALSLIKRNCKHLKITQSLDFYRTSAKKFLNQINKRSYDIIFLDPPYNLKLIPTTVNTIIESDTLKADGLIIAESQHNDKFENIKAEIVRTENYGDTKITFMSNTK